MGKVIEIGIANTKGSQIQKVDEVEVLKGKGLLNDRKFRENNQKERQITLIEIENINYFNSISKTNISPTPGSRICAGFPVIFSELFWIFHYFF